MNKFYISFKTLNSEFPYIEVWLSDQNSKPLLIEDKTSIPLIIKSRVIWRMRRSLSLITRFSTEPRD